MSAHVGARLAPTAAAPTQGPTIASASLSNCYNDMLQLQAKEPMAKMGEMEISGMWSIHVNTNVNIIWFDGTFFQSHKIEDVQTIPDPFCTSFRSN